MRAGDGLLDPDMGRRGFAGKLPIMRQIEARVFDPPDHPRTFDAEARGAEGQPRHVLEGHAVDALLIEIVHVLAIGLAVGDDVEPEIGLILRRPTYHVVGLGLAQRRLLHRVGDLRRARIAADDGVAIARGHSLDLLEAGLAARLVDMGAHALTERARRKTDLALEPLAVLPVDQRRSRLGLVELDPSVGQPMFHGRRNVLARGAGAAIIVGEMVEFRLQREDHELLAAIVLVDPGLTGMARKRQVGRLPFGRPRGKILGPKHGAALSPVSEDDRRADAGETYAVFRDVLLRHELIEEFHDAIGEEMVGGRAEIVFDDGPLAIARLRGAIDGFAAREDQTRQPPPHGRFEHIDHAEHVHIDAEHGIGLDFGAHQIGEVDAMGDVAIAVEDGLDRALVGHIHFLNTRAFERRRDLWIEISVADDGGDASVEEIPDDCRADEARAARDQKLHRASPVGLAPPWRKSAFRPWSGRLERYISLSARTRLAARSLALSPSFNRSDAARWNAM